MSWGRLKELKTFGLMGGIVSFTFGQQLGYNPLVLFCLEEVRTLKNVSKFNNRKAAESGKNWAETLALLMLQNGTR